MNANLKYIIIYKHLWVCQTVPHLIVWQVSTNQHYFYIYTLNIFALPSFQLPPLLHFSPSFSPSL